MDAQIPLNAKPVWPDTANSQVEDRWLALYTKHKVAQYLIAGLPALVSSPLHHPVEILQTPCPHERPTGVTEERPARNPC